MITIHTYLPRVIQFHTDHVYLSRSYYEFFLLPQIPDLDLFLWREKDPAGEEGRECKIHTAYSIFKVITRLYIRAKDSNIDDLLSSEESQVC